MNWRSWKIGEWIPYIHGKELTFLCIGIETATILSKKGLKILFMTKDYAKSIRSIIRDREVLIDKHKINIFKIIDATPSFFGKVISSVDEYARLLANIVGPNIKNKKIVLWFSGGKDSLATLLILLNLQEYVGFDLKTVYVHVPYLDGHTNLRFVDRVSKKLSIDIAIESIESGRMMELISQRGLPFRGYRWCTYNAKVKLMRKIRRRLGCDYEARSERIFESMKRLMSLREYAKQRMFISGTKFRPTYPLTILDVIEISKSLGLIHPHYLSGCSRVSCSLCPYRTIMEIDTTLRDVEDPGFISSVIKMMHRKWYSNIDYEDYLYYSLWRFSPALALPILKIKKLIESRVDGIPIATIKERVSWIWRNNIMAPSLDLNDIINRINRLSGHPVGILNMDFREDFI